MRDTTVLNPRARTLGIAIAPLLVLLGFALRIAAEPAFGDKTPFLFFFPAVVISAALGGWVSGAFAIVLSALAASLSLTPLFDMRISEATDPLNVSVFVLEAALFTFLIHLIQRDRKTAEHRGDELAEALRLIENLVETVPSAIVGTDENGAIVLFNRSAQQLTGYSFDEVSGRPLLDLFVPPEWRETVRLRFDPSSGQRINEPHRNPWILKDGSERMIEWRCASMETPRGARILGVGHDVTETIALERAREESVVIEKQARADAEEANRTKDIFLATVSHELRSPLTSIKGWVKLIRLAPDDADIRDRGLTALEESAKIQARLVDDLLDLSRARAGRLQLRPTRRLDVKPLVESTIEFVLPEAAKRRLAVDTVYPDDQVFIDGDRERLRQVLVNLLQNALRYTDEGRIEVRVQRCDGFAEVIVSDTGKGISAEFLPQIFEPFIREEGRQQEEKENGVGIGLAVVRSLVELHGGRVEAESAGAGMGSKFRITLPLAAELQ